MWWLSPAGFAILLPGSAIAGAALAVFTVGAALFLTAGAAAGAVEGIDGVLTRKKTHAFLDRVITRLGTGVGRRSVPIAVTLMILGVAVASAPFWIEALV